MCAVDRVSLARERIGGAQRDLAAVEFLCVECRHFSCGSCFNPAVQDFAVDPVHGRVSETPKPAKDMRTEVGLCGPEAALFEPRTYRQVVAGSLWEGAEKVLIGVGSIGIAVAAAAVLLT